MKPLTKLPIRNLKNHLLLVVLLLVFLLTLVFEMMAQSQVSRVEEVTVFDSLRVQIETKDGNKFIGYIVAQDNREVQLRTEALGVVHISRSEIVRITTIQNKQMVEGVYWFDNPQATRHFWSPNGYGLKKGEAYYQNVWILFNQVSVGVTDHFTIGAGLVPTFLFGSAETPMWVTPKFSIPVKRDKFNLGIGGLIGTSSLSEKGTGFGIVYGMATFGSRDQNCTVGLGYGYSNGKFNSMPTISFSAVLRVSDRGYFITENYYLGSSSELVLLSFGGRRIVSRTGIDFGLFIPLQSEMSTLVAIPWLGITAPLHKR